jgi:hypothetical protein
MPYNMTMTLMTTREFPRRRRFHRSEPLQPMQMTARDLDLLAFVRRHRFLTSGHLAALDGGNESNVLARLRKLYDYGYLDRPLAQLATIPATGPRPLVYGLTVKGAKLLRDCGHQINANIDWSEKTKRAGAVFIDHTLAIANFMVGVELACRNTSTIDIIDEHQILNDAPAETRSAREPLRWVVDRSAAGTREKLSVVPDGLFGLRFADDTGTFYLLEIDRGTIPIARSVSTHRSITRKLSTYIEGWRTGRHLQQFGLSNLRVITVTNSAVRMENMLRAVDAITDGAGTGFLLFGVAADLDKQNPLDYDWINGRRECVRLID